VEAARYIRRIVVPNRTSPEDAAKSLMIEMVLAGGRRRTLAEFRVLAKKAGLYVVAAGRQESGEFGVECRTV
jgi:hypothetical protein